MVEQHKQAVASIDIGGTNISGGLVDGDGRVLFRMQKSTQASMAAERVLENIISVAGQLMKVAQANSITVSQ